MTVYDFITFGFLRDFREGVSVIYLVKILKKAAYTPAMRKKGNSKRQNGTANLTKDDI